MMNYNYGDEIEFDEQLLTQENKHLLDDFNCENEDIDSHIKNKIYRSTVERGFLVIDNRTQEVIAVYSLCANALTTDSKDDKGLGFAPAMEIRTFAVNVKYKHLPYSKTEQNQTLSKYILSHVIGKILNYNNNHFAVQYVVLYSLKEAINFYKDSGFKEFGPYMIESKYIYTKNVFRCI